MKLEKCYNLHQFGIEFNQESNGVIINALNLWHFKPYYTAFLRHCIKKLVYLPFSVFAVPQCGCSGSCGGFCGFSGFKGYGSVSFGSYCCGSCGCCCGLCTYCPSGKDKQHNDAHKTCLWQTDGLTDTAARHSCYHS